MLLEATYLRLDASDLAALVSDHAALGRIDLDAAAADGRALPFGRGWDELGCLLEGGFKTPETGPTVGYDPLGSLDAGAAWATVSPERVATIANELAAIDHGAFLGLYGAGDEGTADGIAGDRTGEWGDGAAYLYAKLERLRAHYAAAAAEKQAILVRIGPKRP